MKPLCVTSLTVGIVACAEAHVSTSEPPSIVEVEIASGELKGVHISAGNDAPMVLMIPGSGPTDRDGNSPAGLETDAYKKLAHGLFEEGISSVRVDKRGLFSSENAGDPNAVSIEAYASDYRSWLDTLLSDKAGSCIYLLGHSEGGVMAAATAVDRDDVCGLILVATPGRPLDLILEEQLKANPANKPILDQALNAISSLRQGQTVDASALHPAMGNHLFRANVQGFLISMMSNDPVELLDRADVRTLVVQGTTDLQVSLEDADLLSRVEGAELVLIDGMNHVLKDAPEDPAKNYQTYSDPNLPLSSGLVEVIAQFILDE